MFWQYDKRYYLSIMKAYKYEKVTELPDNAMTVSAYAEKVEQKNPPYICIVYDRYLEKPGTCEKPQYKIVNWQGINFVIPD